MTADLTGGGWVGISATDTGGGGSVDVGLLEYLGDPAGLGKNGIVINSVVSWIDIVQEGACEGIWKVQADSHYLEKEITEAKATLWKACGENLGVIVNRQGENAKKKEIDDINDGLRKLKSELKLPLILATTKMVARAPPLKGISDTSNFSDVVAKVKELEECLGHFMTKQGDQMCSLSEMVAAGVCQNKAKENVPTVRLMKEQASNETPRSKKRRLEDEQHSQVPSAPLAADVPGHVDDGQGPGGSSYAAAAAAASAAPSQGINGITPINKPKLRRNSVLVYGKATTGSRDTEEILAADVELVAIGVARDATKDQLKNFIVAKGIEVLEVVKLTTFEQARTNTFKIKIKAAQYEKAMNPDMWPLRVGVRLYRQPRRDQNNGTSWSDQSDRAGGVINPPQQKRPQLHPRNQKQSQGQYQSQHQNMGNPQYPQQPAQGNPQYPQYQAQYPQLHPVYSQQSHGYAQYDQQRQAQYPPQQIPFTQNRFEVTGFETNVCN
jgi:hypothetical protein